MNLLAAGKQLTRISLIALFTEASARHENVIRNPQAQGCIAQVALGRVFRRTLQTGASKSSSPVSNTVMDSSKLIVAAVQIAIYPRVLRNSDDHRCPSVRIGTQRVKGVKLIAEEG